MILQLHLHHQVMSNQLVHLKEIVVVEVDNLQVIMDQVVEEELEPLEGMVVDLQLHKELVELELQIVSQDLVSPLQVAEVVVVKLALREHLEDQVVEEQAVEQHLTTLVIL